MTASRRPTAPTTPVWRRSSAGTIPTTWSARTATSRRPAREARTRARVRGRRPRRLRLHHGPGELARVLAGPGPDRGGLTVGRARRRHADGPARARARRADGADAAPLRSAAGGRVHEHAGRASG